MAAGRLVVDERPRLVEASATKSSPTDIVTVMDTRAEELIRGLLLAERPADAFLGEEGNDHRGTPGITWVVDPIDGTVNYLYDIPAYAVRSPPSPAIRRHQGSGRSWPGRSPTLALRRVYHGALGGGAYERGWDELSGTAGAPCGWARSTPCRGRWSEPASGTPPGAGPNRA